MKEDFDISVGFAAIGSLCIFIATIILDKLNIYFLKEIVGIFYFTGFSMVFSSAAILFVGMVKLDWKKEKFIILMTRLSVIIFFFGSFSLGLSYIISLFGFGPSIS